MINVDAQVTVLPGRRVLTWKTVRHCVILALLTYVGYALAAYFDPPYLREVLETVPVLLALAFVLRLPRAQRQLMPVWLRFIFRLMRSHGSSWASPISRHPYSHWAPWPS